jgi:hypothetical protein
MEKMVHECHFFNPSLQSLMHTDYGKTKFNVAYGAEGTEL